MVANDLRLPMLWGQAGWLWGSVWLVGQMGIMVGPHHGRHSCGRWQLGCCLLMGHLCRGGLNFVRWGLLHWWQWRWAGRFAVRPWISRRHHTRGARRCRHYRQGAHYWQYRYHFHRRSHGSVLVGKFVIAHPGSCLGPLWEEREYGLGDGCFDWRKVPYLWHATHYLADLLEMLLLLMGLLLLPQLKTLLHGARSTILLLLQLVGLKLVGRCSLHKQGLVVQTASSLENDLSIVEDRVGPHLQVGHAHMGIH